jgi:DNA-binding transcriptional regulator YhcF (GntR family)
VLRKPNPSLGIPIYVQLKDQILHAIETGALSPGAQLPGIRSLAESLVINPNTVVRVYHELEEEGAIEVRHGLGAFVANRRGSKSRMSNIIIARDLVDELLEKLRELNLDENEIRRLFEASLMHQEPVHRR